ncbi:glycine betaine ABC transporter substrate-binding protein [Bacillus horti]|uniref:Glycine betaine/choline ABC-type transport system substrate-binding protein n=1 Tax=Caldalkalibacillus horti TaxID=77523 RepID=A0ABT9W419_9BACI|nr:glycine betaine ABC transporter substrate-binding protein [Bacillus horti]MDQ0167837.1 glycine betaine/choline ABC-type transport system substrate-binding protein [Bacillus horti]
MKIKGLSLIIMILLIGLLAAACGQSNSGADTSPENTVVVSGKKFTEQVILANMISILLEERTDINVVNRADLGETDVLHQGMLDGDIDLYVEYTGTGFSIVLKEELDTNDAQEIYNRTKSGYEENYNFTWLEPFDFENTYAISLRPELAEELGVETMSDLAEYTNELTFGAPPAYYEREDGFDGMNETYEYSSWAGSNQMEFGLMYTAAANGEVDVISGFTTDGQITRYNLKVLEDDKKFFPPYDAAPVVRQETLDRHPEIADILAELGPYLTAETMSELNGLVDEDAQREDRVAREFLEENGLID